MDQPLANPSPNPQELAPVPSASPPAGDREARRALLRRLRALLAAGAAAFVLTTWVLVRVDDPASFLPFAPGPSRVVRSHLEALNRGQLRAAYDFFSREYRREIPFPAYEKMVATRRAMFRTRELEMSTREESSERVILQARLLGADGERYVALFTLVRRDGRWWIHRIRWMTEADPGKQTRV